MRRTSRRAYTLIEMLIALVVFAIITTATGFALTAAMRGQQEARQRADDLQEARALFGVLSRDLRAAFASASSPTTFFVADGSGDRPTLTFTTLNGRIDPGTVGAAGLTGSGATGRPTAPQSDVAVVSYRFDPDRQTLSRASTPIPDPGALPPSDLPDTLLSQRVRAISFQFLDPENGLRPDWQFTNEQARQQIGQPGSAPGGAASTTSDVRLPQAVQVMIEMESATGRPLTFTTTIALTTPEPLPAGQTPEEDAPSGGGGGNGGGQGGGGGGGQGGGGLPGLPGAPGLRP